jgi:hypothetical protein
MKARYRKLGLYVLMMLVLLNSVGNLFVGTSKAATTKWVTFKYDDFGNANLNNLLQFNGSAGTFYDSTPKQTVLRLTPSRSNQSGSIFNKARIYNTGNFSFSTFFAFRFSDPGNSPGFSRGADGITFAIQTDSSSAGGVGNGIGYGGISPSLGVKFDTFHNPELSDPSDNYIGLALNGDVDNLHNPQSWTSPWYTNIFKTTYDMKDGNVHYAWIDYDGIKKNIKVHISNDPDLQTATQVLNVNNVDLGRIFAGQSSVYVGFTSATGAAWENHDILEWYFTNKLDPINTSDPDVIYKPAPAKVTITPAPSGEPGKTKLHVTATDPNGDPVSGVPVDIPGAPKLTDDNGNPVALPLLTDSNGQVDVIYDAGNVPSATPKTVTVIAEGGAYSTIAIPASPQDVKAVTMDETAPTLTWDTVTGATYYSIYEDGNLYQTNITVPTFTIHDLAPGTFHTFTVTAVTDGIESPPSNSVTLPFAMGLSLDSNAYTLSAGSTHQTVVSNVYSDGSSVDVTDYSTFSSTNDNVATVDANGLVTAVGAGETVIRAVYGIGSAQATVSVSIDTPTGVTTSDVTSTGATISWNAVPGAQTYNIYDNGNLIQSGVTGTSCAVTELQPGTSHTFTVTAVSNGIESLPSGGSSATTTTLRDLQVDLAEYTLVVGETHQTRTNAVYLDESVKDVTQLATYTSSNPGIVTVDAKGLVTAKSPGTATVTVSYDGKTATETIEVQSAEPQFTLTLNTSPDSVAGDGTSQVALSASVMSTSGDPVPGVPIVFHFGSNSQADTTVTTNAQGIASVTFTAPDIKGVVPVKEVITATATDPKSRLYVKKSIIVSYLPAAVQGVVVDQVTGQPVANATVSVTADFNDDGVIDFSSTVTTEADGSYRIVVPRGDWDYTLNIQTPVQIGNQTVTLNKTQTARVGTLTGSGQTIDSANKISGRLFIANAASDNSGAQPTVGSLFGTGKVSAVIQSTDGTHYNSTIPLDADGNFDADNVPQGDYRISYRIEAPDGTLLAGPTVDVHVDEKGELGVVYSLIDPYGVVTDASTGRPLSGVELKLYWADTTLNKQNGHTPNTLVNLPELPNFAPNKNHNPQTTDTAGEYAWMVYPNGDYYVVASKSGYDTYNSLTAKPNQPANGSDSYITDGVIHVGQNLLSLNFSLPRHHASGDTDSAETGDGSDLPTVIDTKNTHSTQTEDTQSGESKHMKYVSGYPDGLFKPDRDVSRAEVAMMLYRVLQLSGTAFQATTYTDVPESFWGAQAIAAVAHEDIMLGYPDGGFKPNQPITREEMAAVAARVKHPELKGNDTFTDTSGIWGRKEIGAVQALGIMRGYPDGTFRPNQPITRAEAVAVINRLMGRGPLTGVPQPTWPDVKPTSWAYGDIEEASTDHVYEIVNDGMEKWTANLKKK